MAAEIVIAARIQHVLHLSVGKVIDDISGKTSIENNMGLVIKVACEYHIS